MTRKDRLIVKGTPTGEAKDKAVLTHLINKQKGDPIPYFVGKDGRLKYLDKKTTDPVTGVITYGYNDLTKKLEREARYVAEKLKLTPKLGLFQKVFGETKGKQIFLDEIAKSQVIFESTNPDLYDIDHMGSKKFKYPHMARNFNPQLSAANRAEGARMLTKLQETALRVLRNDLETTIQLQGPELTQVQKDMVMNRQEGSKAIDQAELVKQRKRAELLEASGRLDIKDDYPEYTSKEIVFENGVKNGSNGVKKGIKNVLDKSTVITKAKNVLNKPIVKKGGRYALGAGSVALTTLLADTQVKAAQHNPTLRNKILAGGRTAEAGLDWLGLAALGSGIGAPAAVPFELMSMGVGGVTDLGEYLTSDAYKNRGVTRGRSGAKAAMNANK
jgi:hypothetical protein